MADPRCGPCAAPSIAALRFCGVTPPLARIPPASLFLSSARPSSSRSTVTKLSPAFSPAFSAASKARASSGREIDLAGAAAGNFRQLVQRVLGRLQDGAGIAAGAVDQTAGQPLIVVQQHFQHVQRSRTAGGPSRTASDCADWTKPRERSVYFSMFIVSFPRPAAATPKA